MKEIFDAEVYLTKKQYTSSRISMSKSLSMHIRFISVLWEFAGEKYDIKNHSVKPHKGEFEIYRVIMEEFCRICEKYYNSMKEWYIHKMEQCSSIAKFGMRV